MILFGGEGNVLSMLHLRPEPAALSAVVSGALALTDSITWSYFRFNTHFADEARTSETVLWIAGDTINVRMSPVAFVAALALGVAVLAGVGWLLLSRRRRVIPDSQSR